LIDQHEIWQGGAGAHWPSEPYQQLKFCTVENPRWQMTVILKIENLHISATVSPTEMKLGTMMEIGHLNNTNC